MKKTLYAIHKSEPSQQLNRKHFFHAMKVNAVESHSNAKCFRSIHLLTALCFCGVTVRKCHTPSCLNWNMPLFTQKDVKENFVSRIDITVMSKLLMLIKHYIEQCCSATPILWIKNDLSIYACSKSRWHSCLQIHYISQQGTYRYYYSILNRGNRCY